jgi:SynChlorMet cassette protein ScmD
MSPYFAKLDKGFERFATMCAVEKREVLTMNQTDKLIANPSVVLREEFDDWAVLFNPDTADAVGINPVGVAVWKRLDGKRSLEDIVAEIKNSFEETPDAACKEIATFVNTLAEKGFAGLEVKSK